MTIRVSEAAEKDISVISRWYEKKQTGLSNYFFEQLESAFRQIVKRPEAALLFDTTKGLRCYHVKRFPYKIYYLSADIIEVVAVIHTKRSGNYVQRRLR